MRIGQAILAIGVALAAASLCACDGQVAEVQTLHGGIVCADSPVAGATACSVDERLAAFDEWASAALDLPGSTFSVYVGGQRRDDHRVFFTACVPARWGAGVMEAKAQWVREARRRVAADADDHQEASFPEGCVAPRATDVEVVAATSVPAAIAQAADLDPSAGGHHVAIVCDRSTSTVGIVCTPSALVAELDTWVAAGGGATGDRFVVFMAGRSRDTTALQFEVRAPRGLDAGARVAYLVGARRELERLSEAPPSAGSALAEALNVATSELSGLPGQRAIRVLSDGRQVTPAELNFERTVPKPHTFVVWLEANALRTDLRGVDVTLCGLHNLRAPDTGRPFDAHLDRGVRSAWSAAFEAMGAAHFTIQTTCNPQPSANAGADNKQKGDART